MAKKITSGAGHSSATLRRSVPLIFATLLFCAGGNNSALATTQLRHGPTSAPIEARGLAAPEIDAATLVQGAREWHAEGAAQRRFRGSATLAYVTPWHRSGYELAVRFRRKLTHVSPVWYQLRVAADGEGEGGEGGALALVGGHEFNATWLEELRAPTADGGSGDNDGNGGGGGGTPAEAAEAGTNHACDASSDSSDGGAQQKTCAADFDAGSPSPSPSPHHHPPPLIVPRVVVELAPRDLGLLLSRPGPAIDRLVQECERRGYDGLVLEAWQQWDAIGGFRDEAFTEAALSFVRELGRRLKASGGKGGGNRGRVLLLAVPPALPAAPGRPAADVALLAGLVRGGAVAALSVMTYDHLAGPGPGPVAPLGWQRQNLELLIRGRVGGAAAARSGGGGGGDEDREDPATVPPAAVLLGVNFYGYRFSAAAAAGATQWEPDAITSDAFLAALARFKPALRWDAAVAEHKAKYKEGGRKRVVYFPTPAAIAARAALAEEFSAGLSVWELGQGMEAFFDLL